MENVMVAAISNNFCVGKDNGLPWKLPSDLKMFKHLTSGHNIIMGFNTFISLKCKALPNRTNIVIIRSIDELKCDSVTNIDGFKFVLEDELQEILKKEQNFIIGGPKTWEKYKDQIDRCIISHVDANVQGDAYLETTFFDDFREVITMEYPEFDRTNDEYEYVVKIYEKR